MNFVEPPDSKVVKIYKLNFLILILLFGAIASFQFHVEVLGYFGFGGLFTPDTIGMQNTINLVAQGNEINYTTIFGVAMLYYPSFWLGAIYNYCINCMLLYFSCHFFIKSLPLLNLNLSRPKVYLVFFMVTANFYILSVMLHPNKEIPLIFLTNAFVYYALIKQKILLPLFLIVITAIFRDAFALILLLTLIALNIKIVTYAFYRKPYLVASVFIIFLAFFTIENLVYLNILPDISYVLERNISYGSQVNSTLSDLPSYQSFIFKLMNNLSSAALRPQFFDLNSRIYYTGVGLWQFGVISLLGMLAWMLSLRGRQYNLNHSKLILAILICLLLISSGTFTQPRYLMPYIFWLSLGFVSTLKFHHILILFILLFLCSQAFSILGLGVKVPQGIDVYPY